MENKPYSYYVNPDQIQTKDKLTLYNECLLDILTWESDGINPNSYLMQTAIHIKLEDIYDSMNAEEKVIALENKARILRGSHEHNNTIVTNDEEPIPPSDDY